MIIRTHVRLDAFTTFRIGGPADYFVSAASCADVAEAVEEAGRLDMPITVMGGGSNVLVSDEGVRGFVVKNEVTGLSYEPHGNHVLATVGAGVSWDALVKDSVEKGLWGLENLSAIPGSVGAAPIQNIGAYGAEISECIEYVSVFDPKMMRTRIMSNEECSFRYRDSVFKSVERGLIVVSVCLRLSLDGKPKIDYADLISHFEGKSITPSIEDVRNAVIAIRARKLPDVRLVGTAGSFFKNPVISHSEFHRLAEAYPGLPGRPTNGAVKIPLAWILDHVCHMNGLRVGDALVHGTQPLALVNAGRATAKEILALASHIERTVKLATGIEIEREIQLIGM